MYTDNIDENGQLVPDTIKRTADGIVIPFDITDENYQEYLRWQAEQNPLEPWPPTPETPPTTMI